jgi:hypothetical protein
MTAGNDRGVNPPRPSSLGDRFDQVTAARGLSDHRWSLAAGYSKTYLAQLRSRAADDPAWVLPEKTAAGLAAAAAVSAEWLRYGRGSMDPAPTSGRQALIDQAARSASELAAAGDIEGARIAAITLNRLLGVDQRQVDDPDEHSHTRPAFKSG